MTTGKEAQGESKANTVENQVPNELAVAQQAVADLTKKLEVSDKAVKGQQRTAAKLQLQLENRQGQSAEFKELKDTLHNVILPMVSEMYDNNPPENVATQSPSQKYLSKLTKPTQETVVNDPPEVEKALDLAESIGMSVMTSDELAPAYAYFAKGENAKGLAFVEKFVEGNKPKEEKVELTKEDKEKIAREYLEEKGLNTIETGKPVGTTGRVFTDEQIDDPKFFAEHREEMWAALQRKAME